MEEQFVAALSNDRAETEAIGGCGQRHDKPSGEGGVCVPGENAGRAVMPQR